MTEQRKTGGAEKIAAAGSVLTALAIASCCLLPFILLSAGIGGAWAGSLTALAPYKPIFLGTAAVLLAYGFYRVYRTTKQACAPDGSCAPRASRWATHALWIAAILIVTAIVFEFFEPYWVTP